RFHPIDGVLAFDRRAGGQSVIGGLYGEATRRTGPWLLAVGARLDGWETFDSHRLERDIATGAVTLDLRQGSRGGVIPSGRAGARLDIGAGGYLRSAAYSSFRVPTLNELYRPFRVANDITEANAALVPERLLGIETGAGGQAGPVRWSATFFYNRLEDAVTNVTVAFGPLLDPVAGFIPAGGVLRQRRNVGAVNAYGVEADASARLAANLTGHAAVSWTHASVDGGAAAPQLTGLAPAQTPRLSADGDLAWRAGARLTLTADLRYESARFDDDLNRRRLAAAAAFGARLEWRLNSAATIFVAADNLFDTDVATGQTAGGVTSYGPPRTVAAGFTISSFPR
ncbi:MAG: TonB-dependent receptor domain-containing protein, partial [Caulobacteraceae bacterium]